jgi:hypothetical protein
MKDLLKKTDWEKNLFKSYYYCAGCRQRKPCQLLNREYCCSCQFQTEKEKAQEYSNYQQTYQRNLRKRKEYIQQLQLLKSYSGCKQCGSLAVDAYHLYQKNQLVCQPCLMSKEGGSSSPISFLEQQKWYKRYWQIELAEWLEKYNCLPVNKNCAERWLKGKKHLNNCQCLEQEAQENYLLFTNSLKEKKEKLKECQCEVNEKVRVSSDYYAWCEKCEVGIPAASKKRVIKNRNDPRFWGLVVKENVLCGKCLEKTKEKMPPLRRAEFNRYRKVGRL